MIEQCLHSALALHHELVCPAGYERYALASVETGQEINRKRVGILARRVHEGETSILKAWDELNSAHIEQRFRSMRSRCIAVLERKGCKSPY